MSAAITISAVSGRDAHRSTRDSIRLSGARSRSTIGSGWDIPAPKAARETGQRRAVTRMSLAPRECRQSLVAGQMPDYRAEVHQATGMISAQVEVTRTVALIQ